MMDMTGVLSIAAQMEAQMEPMTGASEYTIKLRFSLMDDACSGSDYGQANGCAYMISATRSIPIRHKHIHTYPDVNQFRCMPFSWAESMYGNISIPGHMLRRN